MNLLKSAPAAVLFTMAFAGCQGSEEQTVQAYAAKLAGCDFTGLGTEKMLADATNRALEVQRTNPRCADMVEKELAIMACMSELSCEDLEPALHATSREPNGSNLPKDLPCREEIRAMAEDKNSKACTNVDIAIGAPASCQDGKECPVFHCSGRSHDSPNVSGCVADRCLTQEEVCKTRPCRLHPRAVRWASNSRSSASPRLPRCVQSCV